MLVVVGSLAMVSSAGAGDSAVEPGQRESYRIVRPGVGEVVFSTWSQDGQRWTAVSKDGGTTWAQPRSMNDEIPLQAGVIVPNLMAPPVPKSLKAGEGNRVYLVQFETQSLAAWRARLEELGAEVLGYVPHNSHIVRMDPSLVAQVASELFVRWVGPYEPSYRTFPELLAELGSQTGATRHYNVMTYTAGAREKGLLAAEVDAVGGRVLVAHPEGYILEAELTDAQALTLLASNHVQWIDEWGQPEVDMDIGRMIAGADYVESTPAGYDGTGVRAEVFDTFVDTDHQDFINPVPIHGPVQPDSVSHGTSCYGINFGKGTGNSSARGMVPEAYGYFAYYLPVFNGTVSRYVHTAELVDPSLEYKCVYQSNSVGSARTTQYTSISAEMDDIIWQSDFTIFQSQSNAGDQMSRPQAWAKNIISVGGARHLNNTNSDDDYWSGASVGPAADGRVKPDLTFFYDYILTTGDGTSGYTSTFGGTSGATPMTAGTSGLFFQMWQDNVWGTAPGSGTVFEERPHFTTMKALLVNTAEQYDWTTTNPTITRFRQGWGRPNAQNAYDRAALTRVIDETSVLEELQTDTYTATVPAAQDALKVTMVYADRAGTTSATIHRINDVTLKVTSPGGTVYWGNNGLTGNLWSEAGGAADTINTVENVFIQNPQAGDWTIEVTATEVNMDVHAETPEDDQDYALVVYGVTEMTGGGGGIFDDGFETGDMGRWTVTVP
ncbi:MAG: S8 family serine peptidase [Candidatus Sulfomarinibacteraceae bacterium]